MKTDSFKAGGCFKVNIIENKPDTDFLLIQLILLGMLNMITFKKFDNLDSKVVKLLKEFKTVKL